MSDPVEVHVHVHQGGRRRLRRIEQKLDQLLARQEESMSALTELREEVAAQTTVIGSAIALLNGLEDRLEQAIASGQADVAEIESIRDDIRASKEDLAAAVAENTPAEEPTEPTV